MKFRRLVRRSVMVLVFFVVCLAAVWRVFQPEEQLRIAVLELLQTKLDPNAELGNLSFRLTSVILEKCELTISPAIRLKADRIHARFSLIKFITSGFKLKNAFQQLTISRPVLTISQSPNPDEDTRGWSYHSDMLQSLKDFAGFRSVSIVNGCVVSRSASREIIEELNGKMLFDGIDGISLDLTGSPGILQGVFFHINGNADLTRNEFHVEVVFEIDDIGKPTAIIQVPGFSDLEGSLKLRLAARGTDDLRLNGSVRIRNLKVDYFDSIKIRSGFVDGNLFGDQIKLNGSFVLNGINLPLEGSIENPLNPIWQMKIGSPDIDISDLVVSSMTDSLLRGLIDFQLELSDSGEGLTGQANLASDRIRIGSESVQDIKVAIDVDKRSWRIEELSVEYLGGIFTTVCEINPADWSMDGMWTYYRNWRENQAAWSRFDNLDLIITGTLNRDSSGLTGRGEGKLTLPNGENILDCALRISGNNIVLGIKPDEPGQSIEIDATLTKEPNGIKINSHNPHRILTNVLADNWILEFVNRYELDFNAKGGFDSLQVEVNGYMLPDRRGISADGLLTWSSGDLPGFSGDLKTHFSGGDILSGWTELRLNGKDLDIDRLYLKDWYGNLVLNGVGKLSLDDITESDIRFEADKFPYIRMLELLGLDSLDSYRGKLEAEIVGDGQALSCDCKLDIVFPDSAQYTGSFSGKYSKERLELREVGISQIGSDEPVLMLSGEIDFEEEPKCSAIVTLEQFPVERARRLFTPGWKQDIAGVLNARLELGGPVANPTIELDAHLVDASFYSYEDYWSNARISTHDSLYILENFDLGKGVQGVMHISGIYNRFTGNHELFLNGKDVDIQHLAEALLGKSGPINGKCDFEAHSTGFINNYVCIWKAAIDTGYIGPLSMKRVDGWIRVVGSEGCVPTLYLDSVKVNWGDADAMINGSMPLMGNDSIRISGNAQGELIALIPSLTSFFEKPRGEGNLTFDLGGTLRHPRITKGSLFIRDGGLSFKDVLSGIEGINAHIDLREDGRIYLENLEGVVEDNNLRMSNRFPAPGEDLQTLRFGDYDLGILQFSTGADGVWVVIPNLMKKNWGGFISITGNSGAGFFEFSGPASRPSGKGEIHFHNATFTYPFLKTGHPTSFGKWLLRLLERIRWNAYIVPGWGCRYIKDISGLGEIPLFESIQKELTSDFFDLDVKLYLELFIDENPEGLHLTGSLNDSLYISGELTSERGTIEYLDLDFEVDKVGIRFNPPDINPLLYGTATASIVDTSGIPRDIRLVIKEAVSPVDEGYTTYSNAGVHWESMRIAFEDDQGHSQEEILALMGYAPGRMYEKIAGLGGTLVENVTPIRRWTRNLERQIERWLRVDQIDIEPALAQNLIERQLYPSLYLQDPLYGTGSYISALDRSKLTVGKFVTPYLFVSYTGSLLSGTDIYNVTRLGVIHTWDVLFRMRFIAPSLNLSYRYQYDSLSELDDHTIRINYNFFIRK